jgi:hypothetical protein
MKIELIQDLYSKYSKLALSFIKDRPVAIRGLERRLGATLNTNGGSGIFDIYLHRCLLWQRAGAALRRIEELRKILPTWSWMAYEGGINYMDVPYGTVDWNSAITSPSANTDEIFDNLRGSTELVVSIFFVGAPVHHIIDQTNANMILDEPSRELNQPLQCVIVGTSKKQQKDVQEWCYVVLVVESSRSVNGSYERVGVAKLKRDHIAVDPVLLGTFIA